MRRIQRDFDCLCSGGGSIEFHPCCPGRSLFAARNVETAARDRPARPPRDHGRVGGGDGGGGGARAAGRTARVDGCDT